MSSISAGLSVKTPLHHSSFRYKKNIPYKPVKCKTAKHVFVCRSSKPTYAWTAWLINPFTAEHQAATRRSRPARSNPSTARPSTIKSTTRALAASLAAIGISTKLARIRLEALVQQSTQIGSACSDANTYVKVSTNTRSLTRTRKAWSVGTRRCRELRSILWVGRGMGQPGRMKGWRMRVWMRRECSRWVR